MIANLLNALLGIWLVYAAVLDPSWAGTNDWKLSLAGGLVVALAGWARTTDYQKWQSAVNLTLGVVLLLLALAHWQGGASPLLMFWGMFWPGILVAVLALWAVLYRGPGPQALEHGMERHSGH